MSAPVRKSLPAPLITFLLVCLFAIGGAVAGSFLKGEGPTAGQDAVVTTVSLAPVDLPAIPTAID